MVHKIFIQLLYPSHTCSEHITFLATNSYTRLKLHTGALKLIFLQRLFLQIYIKW